MDNQEGSAVCREDLVLIPQKPRLPMPMTMHEAVAFPHAAERYTTAEVQSALEQVGLGELMLKGLAARRNF